jgi:alkylation response protein AidB-like acyl-CoA dehydrogenase
MSTDVSELRDSARQVLGGLGLAADEHSTWAQIAELGWLMVAAPEALGGLGRGLAGACALQLELGRRLATVPFLPAVLSIEALCRAALSDQQPWLDRAVTGESYIAAPLAESAVSIESGSAGVPILAGTARAVQSADRASHVLVCASNGEHVALVATDQPGVTLVERPTWDATRRLFDLHFEAVQLDVHRTLARGAAAQELTATLAAQRDYLLAADAVGGAAALLELTVEYLQTRSQFGRPLALFQALKHRCADLKAQTEGAEALLLDSLGRYGGSLDNTEVVKAAGRAGRAAKLQACAAYATVAEEALQLHGGIGMTSEHVCHRFLKRAMLDEHLGRGRDCYEAELADHLFSDGH